MPSTPVTTINVTNQLGKDLVLFTITAVTPKDPNNPTPAELVPIYTKVDAVASGTQKTVGLNNVLNRIAICRAADNFPVKVFVPPILADTSSVTVTVADQTSCTNALAFYTSYVANPYSPNSILFTGVIGNQNNASALDAAVNQLFTTLKTGCLYSDFVLVSYWVQNSLYAVPGTFYCYSPATNPVPMVPLVLPQTLTGEIVVGNGTASYTPKTPAGPAEKLTYSQGMLSSAGATAKAGLQVKGLLRMMTTPTNPNAQPEMFWVGTNAGQSFIAQPYQTPDLAWWMYAYDVASAAYQAINVGMMLQMVVDMGRSTPTVLNALKSGASKLFQAIRGATQSEASEAGETAAENLEMINTDVDVDVDVDVDIDVDVDVDVDIDVDIDVDVDFLAIVDVDVDIDVDIDVDNDVDTDDDTDIDIDTDVNVQPGMIRGMLNRAGKWIVEGGWKAILKNVAIMGGMYGGQQLLSVWSSKASEDLTNMTPQDAKPLGLWVSYLQNTNNTLNTRWSTFATYVQQGAPALSDQLLILTSVQMVKNTIEDAQVSQWKWSTSDEAALVTKLATYTGASQYEAYTYLSTYQHSGKTLPLKVACDTVIKYLHKLGA